MGELAASFCERERGIRAETWAARSHGRARARGVEEVGGNSGVVGWNRRPWQLPAGRFIGSHLSERGSEKAGGMWTLEGKGANGSSGPRRRGEGGGWAGGERRREGRIFARARKGGRGF
uniref:Uncharacterized protein n=1 Tax=Oryza sativa subsp. japonica TaxID=39947 RepID=Q7F249_ORYSJ|nr:hypothetical protein [Oryza sativa Japonica Group]